MPRAHTQDRPFIPAAVALLAVALWAPTAMAAPHLKTIFSAENALYGSGYDIGQADGWIDSQLREAVRQYQSDRDHLRTTGNLDADTLRSLGVHSGPQTSISQNVVASRRQALAQLGLQAPQQRVVKQPPVRPEPVVEEPVVAVEETEAEPEPVIVVAQEIQQEQKPEPDIEESQELAENQEDIAVTSKTPEESEPKMSEPESLLPTEPTAAGPSGPVARETRPRSGGGFFSSLFDFLFGWLV